MSLAPWKKSYDKPREDVKKQRHYFPTKVCLVKTMFFPVVMHGCSSWTIKKSEYQGIDAFKLWCWRRLLRVPWTARRSNQSILKEISPEYSLEGLMLKLQYFGHLMWRADSLEKTLMLGKTEDRRRTGWQRMRWLDSIPTQQTWIWANSRGLWRTGKPGVLQSHNSQKLDMTWQLNNTKNNTGGKFTDQSKACFSPTRTSKAKHSYVF